jgi:DNA-binding transcriptional ArsR family regulator
MNNSQNTRASAQHLVDRRTRARMGESISVTGQSPKTPKNHANPPFPDPTKRFDPAASLGLANLVVGYRLEATFTALADPTRRAILARLADGEKSVGELTCGFAMSDAGAAKHLAALEAARLVRRRREGRRVLCTLEADPLIEAALWLRRWQRFESPKAARLRAMLDAAERVA